MAKREPRETTHERVLRKVIGLNSGLRVRDMYEVNIFHDMRYTHLLPLKEFVDVAVGDHVCIISFKWKSPAHQARARKRVEKLFGKYIPSVKKRKQLEEAKAWFKKHKDGIFVAKRGAMLKDCRSYAEVKKYLS